MSPESTLTVVKNSCLSFYFFRFFWRFLFIYFLERGEGRGAEGERERGSDFSYSGTEAGGSRATFSIQAPRLLRVPCLHQRSGGGHMEARELDWKKHTSLLLHSCCLELSHVATWEDGKGSQLWHKEREGRHSGEQILWPSSSCKFVKPGDVRHQPLHL